MSIESLKCKECGATYELGAILPATTASARWRSPTTHSAFDPAETKRRIQAGSQGIWRYADFLPFEGRPGDPLEPGLTPLLRADRLAERLGLDAELWIKNDAANPTHSFKDRVVAVAVAKARELGFDTVACASTGNLANAVAAHAAAAGLDVLRLRPRQPRGAEAARDRRLRDQPGRRARQLRRRQPALHPARRNPALGLRQRQPASLLRGGLEDARLRDRRAARLGAARPRRLPDRLGLALHQGRPRLPGVARPRPGQGEQPVFNGAQAQGCSPVATAFAEGWDVCKPQRPETIAKSLAIGDPADGPYAVEQARSTGGAIDSVTDEEIRDGIRLLAETTGIFTETAGGVTDRRPRQARRARRHRRRRARRRLHHRRGAEDARRDPR